MVKPPKDPNAPSAAQAMALGKAVAAAYRAGWNGTLEADHSPVLPVGNWNYVGVPEGTRRACERKMLVKSVKNPGSGTKWPLTAEGVKAGVADYAARNGGAHPEADAKTERAAQAAKKKEREARVKHARHLFRGLRRSRATDGKKTMAAAIKGETVELTIDDLIVLGEGIERLRNAAPPASGS